MPEERKLTQHTPQHTPPRAAPHGDDEKATALVESPEQLLTLPPYAKQNDIFPRPPLDNTGFLDLSTAAFEFAAGFPGLIVDTGIKDVISLIPDVAIPFAVAVADGSANGFCKLATAAGDHVIGISCFDSTTGFIDPTTGISSANTAHHWSVMILRVGRVWAIPPVAVTRGTPVAYDLNGVLQIGGTGFTVIKGATWATDAQANQLAIVQVNIYA